MKILLTGASGYIGGKLLPVLLSKGYEVICCTRKKKDFHIPEDLFPNLKIIEVDFLDQSSLDKIPQDIDVAYYLIHSMTSSIDNFESMETISANNFKNRIEKTNVTQVIYLSGIQNEKSSSRHLKSRKNVEDILSQGSYHLTTLRAGIIVGSGSASFEIIRDLTEKLPLIIAPRWIKTRSQPIAIRNVIQYLLGVLLHTYTYGQSFDIGGPEILSYKEMLLRFAKYRNLKRKVCVIPLSLRLSCFWLYFISSTSYKLAANLINSMKVEVICRESELRRILNIQLFNYDEAIHIAFDKIEQQEVIPFWRSLLDTEKDKKKISFWIQAPAYGCIKKTTKHKIKNKETTLSNLQSLINNNENIIESWKILYANKENSRLLLYKEIKDTGEAWLDYSIQDNILYEKETFRPLGIWGRIYWCFVKIHYCINKLILYPMGYFRFSRPCQPSHLYKHPL